MRLALFCHSLLSDWNHGNAHFLRGVVTELAARGHAVRVFEPRDAWSVRNLVADHGEEALDGARRAFPCVRPVRYDPGALDLEGALDGCDVVLVHEWTDADLVRRIGDHRARAGRYLLFFHDTHHRAVTRPDEIARLDLSGYDGVLAFGEALRQVYLARGWARRVWTWHEAADVRTFRPAGRDGTGDDDDRGDRGDRGVGGVGGHRGVGGHPGDGRNGGGDGGAVVRDVVWVGNWGDEERTRELSEFFVEPVRALGLTATVHGVRYPPEAVRALADAGVRYAGWLPNFLVPSVFARHRFTVHVPRRAYAAQLPGIPTIRPFEALACGVPLVCAPWEDAEGLFTAGKDYLVARDGGEMRRHMSALASDAALRRELGRRGRATVLARHTCAHRVDELLAIGASLGLGAAATKGAA